MLFVALFLFLRQQHVNIAEDLLDLPNDLAMLEKSKESTELMIRKIKRRELPGEYIYCLKKSFFYNFS
jgi:hypothetical protein